MLRKLQIGFAPTIKLLARPYIVDVCLREQGCTRAEGVRGSLGLAEKYNLRLLILINGPKRNMKHWVRGL